MSNKENRESILKLLESKQDGLTLSVISRTLKLPLDAIRVAVAQLEITNKVSVQVVGASKLIRLKENGE